MSLHSRIISAILHVYPNQVVFFKLMMILVNVDLVQFWRLGLSELLTV